MTKLWPRSPGRPSPHGDPLRNVLGRETIPPATTDPVNVYRIAVSICTGPRILSDPEIVTGIQEWFDGSTDSDYQPRDGSVSFGYGVGRGYGLEHCVMVETATPFSVDRLILFLLTWFAQSEAYVVRNGVPYIVKEYTPNALRWALITGSDVQ